MSYFSATIWRVEKRHQLGLRRRAARPSFHPAGSIEASAEDLLPQAVRDDGGEAGILAAKSAIRRIPSIAIAFLRQRYRLAKHNRAWTTSFGLRVQL